MAEQLEIITGDVIEWQITVANNGTPWSIPNGSTCRAIIVNSVGTVEADVEQFSTTPNAVWSEGIVAIVMLPADTTDLTEGVSTLELEITDTSGPRTWRRTVYVIKGH